MYLHPVLGFFQHLSQVIPFQFHPSVFVGSNDQQAVFVVSKNFLGIIVMIDNADVSQGIVPVFGGAAVGRFHGFDLPCGVALVGAGEAVKTAFFDDVAAGIAFKTVEAFVFVGDGFQLIRRGEANWICVLFSVLRISFPVLL